jgi:hypothetical protein
MWNIITQLKVESYKLKIFSLFEREVQVYDVL